MINYGATVAPRVGTREVLYKTSDKSIEQGSAEVQLHARSTQIKQATLAMMETELESGRTRHRCSHRLLSGATREEVFDVYEWSANKGNGLLPHREGKSPRVQQEISDRCRQCTALHIVHLNSVNTR